jgi:hypothetical protein
MLLLLVSASTASSKGWFTRLVQEYEGGKTKYPLQKDANLIKQKYMTQETATQNIKNQLKSSTENEKMEGHMRNPMHGQFYWVHERPSVDKEKFLA